jgi:hypothetical protein
MWCSHDKKSFDSDNTGQITLNSEAGIKLAQYAKNSKNIVEIGTWSGLGSTRCLLRCLSPEASLFTIETNLEKVKVAQKNLESEMKENVTFLWGSVLSIEDIKDTEVIFPELSQRLFRGWHTIDMENIKNSPNILNKLPSEIDFLFLDGGEFTTWYEFQILFPRCTKYIALDDVNVSKCKKIRQVLKNNPRWEEIEHISERNGFSIFKYSE